MLKFQHTVFTSRGAVSVADTVEPGKLQERRMSFNLDDDLPYSSTI